MEPENVWEYPRPPRLDPVPLPVRVVTFDGRVVASSTRALAIKETSHPPTYYIPPDDVDQTLLRPEPARSTMCEWKGAASYYSVGDQRASVWQYRQPQERYAALRDYYAFYPSKFECYVGDERVVPQEGDFYGGWRTKNLVGPFKGGAGTLGW